MMPTSMPRVSRPRYLFVEEYKSNMNCTMCAVSAKFGLDYVDGVIMNVLIYIILERAVYALLKASGRSAAKYYP